MLRVICSVRFIVTVTLSRPSEFCNNLYLFVIPKNYDEYYGSIMANMGKTSRDINTFAVSTNSEKNTHSSTSLIKNLVSTFSCKTMF